MAGRTSGPTVIAEQQWITYRELLPAMGVRLAPYRGYRPDVRTSLANEFATVGYRSHSMVRGDLKIVTQVARYSPQQLETLRARGMTVTITGSTAELTVPPRLLPFNPDLVDEVQIGPLLQSFGRQQENRDDELQHAIWQRQFEALRDGNRFFHENAPALRVIRTRDGIDHRRTLGDVIAANTDVPRAALAHNVFRAHPSVG